MGQKELSTYKKLMAAGVQENLEGIKTFILFIMFQYPGFTPGSEIKSRYQAYMDEFLSQRKSNLIIPNIISFYEDGFWEGFNKIHDEDLITCNLDEIKGTSTHVASYSLTFSGRWQAFHVWKNQTWKKLGLHQ